MMTHEEEREWVTMLGPTREDRLRVVTDLLLHANGDEMSEADRTICRRWKERLGQHWGVTDEAGRFLMNAPDQWTTDRRRARWFEEGEANEVIERLETMHGYSGLWKERV